MNVVKNVTLKLNNEEIDALKCLVCLSDIDEIYKNALMSLEAILYKN